MRNISSKLAALYCAATWLVAPPSQPKLTVVTTTPDLGALAKEIGGDLIDVKTLAKPTEDPHFVDAKPSHVVTLNRADVLIDGGAELEIGWLPPLLESARNGKIVAGGNGRISVSQRIAMLEVPATLDRARGDVHSLGNPHFLMNPDNAKIVAAEIAERFSQLVPGSAAQFNANLERFNKAVDAKAVEWKKAMEPYRGASVVTYHNDFIYFAQYFGLKVVETLEPKPGIAPSPSHLAKVIATMRTEKTPVVLVQPYQNRKTAETVARQTGATVLDVSQQPGALKNTATYVELMDTLIRTISTGLEGHK